jgi:hypothetical protein
MQPQPIETAPKDGTVILTDVGIVRWLCLYGYCRPNNWVMCAPCGHCPECADNGYFIEEPTLWTPLPDWMKG